MNTVKEILTANRESIISSIKFVFKVWKSEDVRTKMIEFLGYAQENEQTVINAANAKNTKSLLKVMVQKMAISQMREKDSRSLAELKAEYEEANNLKFNLITKRYEKYI